MVEGRIRKVVVLGGGTAGWMAAAALARFLGPVLEIEVVESEAIGIVGVGEATIPQIRHLNAALNLDEDEFLRRTKGTFKLGIEFVDWRRLGDRYIHTFGDIGVPLGQLPFHHYWVRARAQGDRSSLWDYCVNTAAARANRFARVDDRSDSPVRPPAFAFHFDAALYGQFLRAYAEARGAKRTEGKVVHVEQGEPDGAIAALHLESGARIPGDLFIDCTGFRGVLIEETLKTGYEDWTELLPANRAIAVPCATSGPLRPYTQAIARPAGWQWRIPLQHRVGNGHVFSSAHMSEDEATAILLANLEGEPLAEPRTIKFVTGRRKAFWNKNVVALGLASGFMEPLESTSIHLVQSGVSRLIELFPANGLSAIDIDEYNRQSILEFERIRDFLVLHYSVQERDDTAFWRERRSIDLPPELRRKLDLFRAGGRIVRQKEDLFTESSWLQVMVGQGVEPLGHHPMADAIGPEQLARYLSDIKMIVARNAGRLPSHGDYVAACCRAKTAIEL